MPRLAILKNEMQNVPFVLGRCAIWDFSVILVSGVQNVCHYTRPFELIEATWGLLVTDMPNFIV